MTNESPFSLNNKLVVEPYKNDKVLKANVSNGFAMISQKIAVKGLKLLMDAKLTNGDVIPKGYVVHIREEVLFTQPFAKQVFESESVGSNFMVVDIGYVDFITPPKP